MRAQPDLTAAVRVIVDKIDASIPKQYQGETIKMFVGGGIAANYHCGTRYTEDIDASFSKRLLLNFAELNVPYTRHDGSSSFLYLDPNYNTSFALLHEDFEVDAIEWKELGNEQRRVHAYVFSPEDLAVSKIARFSEQDREDIKNLAGYGLIDAAQVEKRASAALKNFIGNVKPVQTNIETACRDIAETRKLF
jgi:hypothetical protein